MKKITKQFLFLSVSFVAILGVSCSKDDHTNDSVLIVKKGLVVSTVLAAPLALTQTVNESSEAEYSFTVSIPEPATVDIAVDVKQISGSATNGADFSFDNHIVIPAFATSATGMITIKNDGLIEGDEDFTLQIGTGSTANASITSTSLSFIIKNYLSSTLDFTFGYNQTLAIPGVPGLTLYNVSAGGNTYDMDYFVLDEQFNDTGIYDAATAAEPEKLSISNMVGDPTYLADGTYYIFYSLYSDATLSTIADLTPIDVPTTVDYKRDGGIEPGTFIQEADFVPTTKATPGDTNFVISFTMLNGVYTLNNSIPVVIASGRSSLKNKLNVAVANARRNHKI